MTEVDNTNAFIKIFEPLLKDLSLYELIILNKMAVERIRLMQKVGVLMSMSVLNVGVRVSWNGKVGIDRTRIIIRLNSKTASVKIGDEGYWKVPPHLFRKEN